MFISRHFKNPRFFYNFLSNKNFSKHLLVGVYNDTKTTSFLEIPDEILSSSFIKNQKWETGIFRTVEYFGSDEFSKIGFVGLGNYSFSSEDPTYLRDRNMYNQFSNEKYPNLNYKRIKDAIENCVREIISSNEEIVVDIEEDLESSDDKIKKDEEENEKKLENEIIIALEEESSHVFAMSFAHGSILGKYNYLCKDNEKERYKVKLSSKLPERFQREFDEGIILGRNQNLARYFCDLPSNLKYPKQFGELIKKEVKEFVNGNKDLSKKIRLDVRNNSWIKKNKFNCTSAVSNGSDNEPRVIEMKYTGNLDNPKNIDLVLVSKGITFDTGGIDLKPVAGMKQMKGDMGGTAVAFSAIKGMSELNLPLNVVLVAPLCENMPSGKAIKPGDVVLARNDKIIEVENTDAEGRLILSDALSYACETYDPEVIVDIATLTGAIKIALGDIPAIFSSNNEIYSLYEESSLEVCEISWRMPLFSEKFVGSKLKTNVGDLRNVGGDNEAGACVAAAFLSEFVDCKNWIHLDIAGAGYCNNRFTGSVVSSLITFGKKLSNAYKK